MIVDCHVHVCAFTPPHGSTSPYLLNTLAFRFMRWRLGLPGADERTEQALETRLIDTIRESRIDAAVVLAFDAVYVADGIRDDANTHLYVTNDYVIELAARHKEVLFGCSVHPYRKDAIAELERCVSAGAVLCKWLPPTQGMDPADERCIPFYEALAHHKLPLLCHTGGEQSLPRVDDSLADPMLLEPALQRGVTVIAAHCGTRSRPGERDYVPEFIRLAEKYEHLYGDTSALNLPTRWYGFDAALKNPVIARKLVHGSDWPIIALPPPTRVGWGEAWHLMGDDNWMARDVKIKQRLGFDDEYWGRAAKVLRLPRT